MQLKVNLSKFGPKINKIALLTLMTIEADFVMVDPISESLIFDDGTVVPSKYLGASGEDWIFDL